MTDNKPPQTAWMWPTDKGGVNGASLDRDAHTLTWYEDAAACACGDSSAVQDFASFAARGPVLPVPDDVLAEIRAAVQTLST